MSSPFSSRNAAGVAAAGAVSRASRKMSRLVLASCNKKRNRRRRCRSYWFDHRQGRGHRDRRIESVAALADDFHAGLGRQRVGAGDRRSRRMRGGYFAALVCEFFEAGASQNAGAAISSNDARNQGDIKPARGRGALRIGFTPVVDGATFRIAAVRFRRVRDLCRCRVPADDHALRLIKVAEAFGAARRIDHIDGFALGDGLIGQAGSRTSQLTQSSLILSDMGVGVPAKRASACAGEGFSVGRAARWA